MKKAGPTDTHGPSSRLSSESTSVCPALLPLDFKASESGGDFDIGHWDGLAYWRFPWRD